MIPLLLPTPLSTIENTHAQHFAHHLGGSWAQKPICLLAPLRSWLQTHLIHIEGKVGGSSGVGGTQGVRGPCESQGYTDLGVPDVGLAPYPQSLPW